MQLQAEMLRAAAQKSEINADLNVEKTEGIIRLRPLYTAVQQAAKTGDKAAFENAKEQYAYAYASEQAKHQATKARAQSRENAIDNEVKQAISGAQEQLAAFQASGDDDILDLESARASQRAGEGVQLDALVDGLQIALDVVGLVPGFGEVADGLNALISLLRGDYVGAGLSVASMIPFAGWLSTAGKAGKYMLEGADAAGTIAKYGDEAIDAVESMAKYSDQAFDTGEAILKSTGKASGELVEGAGKATGELVEGAGKAADELVEGAGDLPKAEDIIFGSEAKPSQKLQRQMDARGWTNDSVKGTVSNYYTTRSATNRATGNPATVYYNKDGSYIVVDNVTNEVVQVSNKFDSNWAPDPSIIDPYLP